MTPNDIKEPFLRKLRQVIDQDPDLTEAGLAVKADLNNSAIRGMFKNADKRSPRIDTARKICAALGTTLEEFLSDARTEEEKEITHLVMKLPEHLRQQLLGYGRGLADAADLSRKEDGEGDE
ncbi:helix-turn-helix protein (plasmid) [Phaeobacter inhibens]|uniref:Helix-turn-helix protein n=2 Tax=Phaeobacter inhibens TaxID=221822 RepID=A0ABN5GY82_9RHOB|nr:helix-turn-helix protein [Phaeobacter inhibens]AUQ97416.1 helix-turn-helix protein [Phaeobacter inhibens]